MRDGGCACGEVRYRVKREPMFVHCCHCTSCQTETGSAFVINALVESGEVETLKGEAEPAMTPPESGKGAADLALPEMQGRAVEQLRRRQRPGPLRPRRDSRRARRA